VLVTSWTVISVTLSLSDKLRLSEYVRFFPHFGLYFSLVICFLLSETRSVRCNTCPFVGCSVQNEHKQLSLRVTAINR
jgi:hypothetical protein